VPDESQQIGQIFAELSHPQNSQYSKDEIANQRKLTSRHFADNLLLAEQFTAKHRAPHGEAAELRQVWTG
jgi:hypothetical protein